MSRRTLAERFWPKVEKTEGCWNWTGATNGKVGYGRIGAGTKPYSWLLAHRASYEMSNGPIPEGLVIDHICHNRKCVNPDHLRAITQKQNMANRKGPNVGSRSGHRGVIWHAKAKKWQARAAKDGKAYSAGLHETIEDAAAAAQALRDRLYTTGGRA